LWPHDEELLIEYEDRVLERLAPYGARLLDRMRVAERGDGPFEIHVIEFPNDDAFEGYMNDPDRIAMADLRERAIARTEVLRVARV